jgi:hypothetical protein
MPLRRIREFKGEFCSGIFFPILACQSFPTDAMKMAESVSPDEHWQMSDPPRTLAEFR